MRTVKVKHPGLQAESVMKLSNIHTVLFDMDGVITSEYLYWDAAALTVLELLCGKHHFGRETLNVLEFMRNVKQIRETVFCGEQTIRAVKDLGVNTNWDLAYLTFCIAKIVQENENGINLSGTFERVLEYFRAQTISAPELYDIVGKTFAIKMGRPFPQCKRGDSPLWAEVVDVFQHWFLGSERHQKYILDEAVREGLNRMEQPIVPLSELHTSLSALKQKGLTLGIGTGRPKEEIALPLNLWDIVQYFDFEHCVTYTDVLEAERELKTEYSLAKPHPFVFLKAMWGCNESNQKLLLIGGDTPQIKETLVVGDAASDLLAAKKAGFPFAAVLTGAGTKDYFEANGPDLILESITQLPQYL